MPSRDKPQFTEEEVRGFVTEFIAHFGHLDEIAVELRGIHAELVSLADRLELLTIKRESSP